MEQIKAFTRALFMDLDGTLIETISGKTFPENVDDWKLKNDVVQQIRKIRPYNIFIITNQGGVESGYISMFDFAYKIQNIIGVLSFRTKVIPIYYNVCFSMNDLNRRKPAIGMIDEIFKIYKKLDRSECIFVGDASGKPGQFGDSDKVCAESAGIKYFDVEDFINAEIIDTNGNPL